MIEVRFCDDIEEDQNKKNDIWPNLTFECNLRNTDQTCEKNEEF